MRIAICVQKLTGGGAERVAAMWATGFYQRGHNVCVLLTDSKAKRTYSIPEGVEVFSVDVSVNNGLLSKIRDRTVQISKMRNVFKRWHPDVVISVLPFLMRNIKIASLGLNHKIISTDHNSFQRPNNAKLTLRQYLRKYYYQNWADAVTVLTNADKIVIGDKIKNVFVLPNPLAFNPIDAVNEKENIILAMGRLDAGYIKGFDVLIKAFAKIKDSGWLLYIVGDGSKLVLEKYKQMTRDFGIEDSVRFIGFTANPEEYYKKASIFVLSSRYEGFGLVLIEAMSQGCACIACDYHGRQKEIVCDEKYGIICPPDDVDSLAKAIELMIYDEVYRKNCQLNAPKRAACYKLDNIMDIWSDIFKVVL